MKKRFLIITMIVLGLFAFGGLSACNLRGGEHQHQFNSNWSFDAVYHWHAAVCEHRNEIDGKARHTLNGENRCTVCNYLLKTTNGLAYELNEDEASYTVSGYGKVKSTDIIIPSEYEGYPVTAIKERAFVGYSRLKNLLIPDSVTYVGPDAFLGCNQLVYNEYANAYYIGNENNLYSILVKAKDNSIPSCTIYDKTNFVCSKAFKDCVNLRNITIPETVKGFGTYVFAGSGLTQITIPDTFDCIDDGFFSGCADLKDVTLSSNVKTIRPYAFSDCKSLNAIDLTDDIETVEGYAFYNSAIKNLKISGTKVDIKERAFINCQIDTADLYVSRIGVFNKNLINNLVIGGGDLGNNLFENCANLTTVTVKGDVNAIGESCFAGCTKLTDITFEEGFTQLGKKAFDGCTELKNVTFPDSISKIGEDAFAGCNAVKYNPFENGSYLGNTKNPYMVLIKPTSRDLTNCRINDTAKVVADRCFKGCELLRIVVFGKALTEITEYMFAGCVSINDLDLFNTNIKKINANAFDGCTELTDIYLPDSLEYIGTDAFKGCENISYNMPNPKSSMRYLGNAENPYLVFVKVIGTDIRVITVEDTTKIIAQGACVGCTLLDSIVLKNVKYIGDQAFRGLNFTTMTIPGSVISLGKGAFSNCRYLKNVEINADLKELPENTFDGCSLLEEVKLPENLEIIGDSAFASCSSLQNIVIPESVTTIGVRAFYNCYALTNIEIPDSVTYIGEFTFYNCNQLKSVKLPKNLEEINKSLFYFCKLLEEIEWPEKLITIRESAFSNLAVKEIRLPEGVTTIEDKAFAQNSKLTTVYLPSTLKTIGNAFTTSYSIDTIYYNGTRAQWDMVDSSLEPRAENRIYCTDDKN